ncbi:MAG: lysophospholipid acyltransferase family protein [Pseudomonadota bacterium]
MRAVERDGKRGFIIAFWHCDILMAPSIRRHLNRRLRMLVSAHRDGEIIVNAVAGFGIDFIRGSSANEKKLEKDKGGASAVAQLIGAIEHGDAVGLTPDGPKGPAKKTKVGVVKLAAMTGAPIITFSWVASRRRILKTWDGFQLAFPFSTIKVSIRPAVEITEADSHADVAAGKATIEDALRAANDHAELMLASSTTVPASSMPRSTEPYSQSKQR